MRGTNIKSGPNSPFTTHRSADENAAMRSVTSSSWFRPAAALQLLIAGLLLAACSGCRVAQQTAKLPGQMMTAVVPGMKPKEIDPAALQTEVLRFADEFSSRTSAALDAYAQAVGSPAAHHQALVWKVSVASAAVNVATGPNPSANLLDFLSLTTITRTALEQDWTKSPEGAAFQPWLETSRALEIEAWKLADGVFTPSQQQELRENLQKWWDANSSTRLAFFVRPQEFSSLIRQTAQKAARPGSVFAMVGLDPTAGIDPAVREVTRTRLFAERAMFTAQRMPFLLRAQIELLTAQVLDQQQVTTALTSAERLSHAAESASQTAAQLPERLAAERKAILAELEAQEGKLRELSGEVSRTLAAGEKMSTSLNTTLITFDALMKRFGVGEPSSTPPDTNAPPFNILDYAKTAEQVAGMAQQLDILLKDASGTVDSPALDKRIASLNAATQRARDDTKSILNHAFLLAAGLIGLCFIAAVGYRRLTAERTPASTTQPPAKPTKRDPSS